MQIVIVSVVAHLGPIVKRLVAWGLVTMLTSGLSEEYFNDGNWPGAGRAKGIVAIKRSTRYLPALYNTQ